MDGYNYGKEFNINVGESREDNGTTIPIKFLLEKLETTDTSPYDIDNYKNYVRGEIKDRNDNDNWLESDTNRRSGLSEHILNTRFKGTRGNIPNHGDDLWIAEHEADPRGSSLDPLLKDYRSAIQTRRRELEVNMGSNADFSIDQGVWRPNIIIEAKQMMNKMWSNSAKIFSVAFTGGSTHGGRRQVYNKIDGEVELKTDSKKSFTNNNRSTTQLRNDKALVEGLNVVSYATKSAANKYLGKQSTIHDSELGQSFAISSEEKLKGISLRLLQNIKQLGTNNSEVGQGFNASVESTHKKQIVQDLTQFIGEVEMIKDSSGSRHKKGLNQTMVEQLSIAGFETIANKLDIEKIKQYKSPLVFSDKKIDGEIIMDSDSKQSRSHGKLNLADNNKGKVGDAIEMKDSDKTKSHYKIKSHTDISKIRESINTEISQSNSSNLEFKSYKQSAPIAVNIGAIKTSQESSWGNSIKTTPLQAYLPDNLTVSNKSVIEDKFKTGVDEFDKHGSNETNNRTGITSGRSFNRSRPVGVSTAKFGTQMKEF